MTKADHLAVEDFEAVGRSYTVYEIMSLAAKTEVYPCEPLVVYWWYYSIWFSTVQQMLKPMLSRSTAPCERDAQVSLRHTNVMSAWLICYN